VAELSREQMQRLTRRGALAVLEELEREAAAIRRAFPGLVGGRGRQARTASVAASAGVAVARRRRPAMSAANRKAVSERMKKYWAERRKAKAKK
jgi:hypothetical protein